MTRMPLYPAFLAATALLDTSFNRSLTCFVEQSDAASCPQRAPLARILQFVMTAAVYLMLWRIAVRATASQRIGWLSLGVGLLAAPILMRSVLLLMTETTALFFITGATAAAVEAVKGRRPIWWLLMSGAMIGLAAMTRPEFAYLLLAAAIVGACIITCRPPRRRGIMLLAVFLLGGAIVIAPWVARNAVVLGRPAMSSGYASNTLAQRVAFDTMSWHQYALSYLCALPEGNGISHLVIGPDACEALQIEDNPHTLYVFGNTTFMQDTINAAGGPDRQFGYLIRHYILADPLWHILVSIPMAMRGLWINHYWGMVLAILCVPMTLSAVRRGDYALLAVTLPAWFMLAFHAAVAVNTTRYNLMLVIPFALAGGITLDRLWRRWEAQRRPKDTSGATTWEDQRLVC
jgi:4-amino-4-deoxy-L-arabinose transferase-like glycosyltransferase